MENINISMMAALELGGILVVLLSAWWWAKSSLKTITNELIAERKTSNKRFEKLVDKIEDLEEQNTRTLDITMSHIRKIIGEMANSNQKILDSMARNNKEMSLAIKDVCHQIQLQNKETK